MLLVKNQFFICIAAVKLLQSLQFFKNFLWKTLYWKCFALIAKTKALVKTLERKLREFFLSVTKEDVQSQHFFVLTVPTSQHFCSLISLFTIFKKDIIYRNQRKFLSVNFVAKFLLGFVVCDYTNRIWTTKKFVGHRKCGCDIVGGREWRREFTEAIGNKQALSCGL